MNKLLVFRKLLKDFQNRWNEVYPGSLVEVAFCMGDIFVIQQKYPRTAVYKDFYSLADLMDGLKAPVEDLPRIRGRQATIQTTETTIPFYFNPAPWDNPTTNEPR